MDKAKVDIIIKNCSVMTKEFVIEENQSIAINNSLIVDIDDVIKIDDKYIGKENIGGKGKLFMPGLVDAHTHTCQQLLRGRIMDEIPMIWKRIMVPFESSLNENDISISSELSCLEMIKSGTTSFADAGGIFMDRVCESVIKSGLRAAITSSTMDNDPTLPKNMISSKEEAINKNIKLYKDYNNVADGRLKIWFSLRTLISCSPGLIVDVFKTAKEYKTGIHMHMNEYLNEINYSLERYKKRPIEYLESLGVLGPNLLSAHTILVSENEIDILKDYDVKVVHCPISNFGKGIHKTPRMLQSNISVGFGTDGTAHAGKSLFNEIKVFRSAMHANQGVSIGDPLVMPAKKLLEMVTVGGARAMLNDDIVGTLEVNKKADLISINLEQSHILPSHNLINTIVETVNHNDVMDMIVDGKLIMKDRQVLTLDEEKIIYNGKIAMKDMEWQPLFRQNST